MLTIRRDQLQALGDDRARRARLALAAQLRQDGLDAIYDAAAQRLDIRDGAGGSATMAFGRGGIALTTGEGRRFVFEYDDRQRLSALTDPAGFRVGFEHDQYGALTAIRRGDHSAYEFELDEHAELELFRRPDGTETHFTRDASGRAIAVTGADGRMTEYGYAHAGLPQRIVDPVGSATSYEYDEPGDLHAVVWADGSRQEYDLDPATIATTVRKNGRAVATVQVDPDTGSRRIDHADGTWTRLVVENGRMLEGATESSAVRFEYDAHGQLLSEDSDGRVVRYLRNAVGALLAIVTPDGERIEFDRDAEHRVRCIRDWTGGEYGVSYEPSGALAGITYPNGVSLTRNSTAIGLPERLQLDVPGRNTPALDLRWTYDRCDRVVSESNSRGEKEFEYDVNGRLIAVRSSDGSEAFEIDGVGNRLRNGSYSCEYNALNQLLRRDSETYRYDDLGSMTEGASPSGAVQCRYDGRGQMVEVRSRAGVTRYAYDPIGRRIRKEHGGRVTTYVWAGIQLLSETTEDGGVATRRDYLVFPEAGTPLAMRVGTEPYYLHHGRRQEPLAATNRAGRIAWQAEYSSFGQAQPSIAEIEQPFRLVGQYFDSETGLHYNVRRYYDPEIGRFLSMDPLGFEGGSLNLYAYCDGDPLNRADPIGELAFLAPILIGAAIGAVVGAAAEAWRQRNDEHFNLGNILKEAGKGAVVGAIGGGLGALLMAGVLGGASVVGASVLSGAILVGGGAAAGGAVAAIEQCVDNKLHDRPIGEDVGRAAIIGGVIGGLTAGAGAIWANRARRAVAGIRGFGKHGLNRVIERGIKPKAILDALKNPLKKGPVKFDKWLRPSQRLIGKEAEVVVNPWTKQIVSVNPTSSKKAMRLMKEFGK